MIRCVLDMDGVVANFVAGAMEAHGKPWPYDEIKGDDAWDLPGIWGISASQFWKPFGREFWANLPKHDDADEIVNTIAASIGRENICFLTSPCLTDGCMDGKKDWVRKHYPDIPILFSLSGKDNKGTPKHFCASPNTILVDDHTPNVIAFDEAGGYGHLLGRPWNRRFAELELGINIDALKIFLDIVTAAIPEIEVSRA